MLVFCNNAEERKKTMKKLAILFAMMFAVALWFGSTVSATETTDSVNDPEDTVCLGVDNDIKRVEAMSVEEEGIKKIKVTVIMWEEFDNTGPDEDPEVHKRMVKYRLHIDHKDPNGERYGDGHVFTMDNEDTEDDCETSSDDGVMFRVHKNGRTAFYGPGEVQEFSLDPYTLVFTVPYAGLLDDAVLPEDREGVEAGDVVHLWMDVQQKQICDRAPDTDDGDFCAKPEIPSEVLSILLQ
jgi:hypothetical protein